MSKNAEILEASQEYKRCRRIGLYQRAEADQKRTEEP